MFLFYHRLVKLFNFNFEYKTALKNVEPQNVAEKDSKRNIHLATNSLFAAQKRTDPVTISDEEMARSAFGQGCHLAKSLKRRT